MKRDKELIRELLLHFEHHSSIPETNDDERQRMLDHCQHMCEGELISASVIHQDEEVKALEDIELTYKGYELMDDLRSDSNWRVVKRYLQTYNFSLDEVSFDTIQYFIRKRVAGG